MKTVPIEKAVGMALGHDITQIVPGVFKGVAFKRGYIIQKEDISKFLEIGKENIYVIDIKDKIHEDDAAKRIAKASIGKNIKLTEPSEGKVGFIAEKNGLLKINVKALNEINNVEDVIFSTMHTNQRIKKDQTFAGTRIIPLCTKKENIKNVEEICKKNFPLIEIKPFFSFKAGIVTTGSEIYHGRIKDKFGGIVTSKFEELGSQVFKQILVSDDVEMTVNAIHEIIRKGAEIIAITGGMSVDPDDQTPTSIVAAGGKVVKYGAPVLPGAMFMLAYIDDIPIIGLPACVIFYKTTILDLLLPRILSGEKLTAQDINVMGHGGFCQTCSKCRYPVCGFGKGGFL
jgi:hypothetical protein